MAVKALGDVFDWHATVQYIGPGDRPLWVTAATCLYTPNAIKAAVTALRRKKIHTGRLFWIKSSLDGSRTPYGG